MAISMSTAAYASVIVGGLALFAIGHPAGEPQPTATTPGRAGTPVAAPVAPATAAPPAASSVAAAGFTLTTTAVDLPTGDRGFPAGPNSEVMQQNCAACHSVGMVLNQPSLTKAAWEGEVNKMRAVYKAPVDAADVPAIVTYLASIKGAP